ncbi:MAG: hypothetical protein JWR74_2141 [Polaromonas sp.]|nr:hypothetical protein [Polaromonas sp.]
MSKWFKCIVTASRVLMVEVEDDDTDPRATADNIAINEAFGGTFDDVVTSGPSEGEDLEREKRHADQIIPIG